MASEALPVRNAGVLVRIQPNLLSPAAYLAVFGGMELAYLWKLQGQLGTVIPAVASLGFGVVLVLVLRPQIAWRWKITGLGVLITLMTVLPLVALIVARQHAGLTTEYDGLTQDEISIDRLVHGQRIYGVGFAGTAMEGYRWMYGGVDLRHYQHFPLMPLAGVPVRLVADSLHAPFDYRMVLLVFVIIAAAAIVALPIAPSGRFLIGVALFVDPLVGLFLFSGHDDLCMVAMLLVSLALLARGHPLWASLALGTAAAFKPFALLVLPFLLLAIWLYQPGRFRLPALAVGGFAVAPLLTIVPFLVVDAGAFWRDVVQFGTGSGGDAYPITGFGFPALLLSLHVIARPTAPYPALPLQVAAMLPTLWLGLRALARRPTLAMVLAGSIGATVVFLFFARYFSDNYLATLFALAACIPALGSLAAVRPGGPSALAWPPSAPAGRSG